MTRRSIAPWSRLAHIFTEAATICSEAAESTQDQLEDSGHSALMDGMAETPQDALKQMLTVSDLAHLLQVDESTVRRWHRTGKLPPAVMIGNVLRWDGPTFDDWLQAREGAA